MYLFTDIKHQASEHSHSERNTLHHNANDQESSRNSPVRSTSPDTHTSLEDGDGSISRHRQLQDNEIGLGSLHVHGARGTGTGLVNMEQGVGTPSLTHHLSVNDVSTPHPTAIISVPPLDQTSKMLHEHNFYTESWFQDLITVIFLLIISNAIMLSIASVHGTSSTIQNLVQTFYTVSSWVTITYVFGYVWCCVYFHLHPAKLDKWTRLLKIKRYRGMVRWAVLSLVIVGNIFTL